MNPLVCADVPEPPATRLVHARDPRSADRRGQDAPGHALLHADPRQAERRWPRQAHDGKPRCRWSEEGQPQDLPVQRPRVHYLRAGEGAQCDITHHACLRIGTDPGEAQGSSGKGVCEGIYKLERYSYSLEVLSRSRFGLNIFVMENISVIFEVPNTLLVDNITFYSRHLCLIFVSSIYM